MSVENLGCWKDTSTRAIELLEGKHELLQGSYHTRSNPYDKCLEAALSFGYEVFSLQNGGQCGSAANAGSTYTQYGGSGDCRSDGEGGPWSNQVYKILKSGEFLYLILSHVELLF